MTMSPTPPVSSESLSRTVSAVLDWWKEAGLENCFRDQPEGWLRAAEAQQDGPVTNGAQRAESAAPAPIRAASSASALPLPRIGGDRASWPDGLAQFKQWWLSEESLGEPGAFPRIAPAGEHGAQIMLLVPMPEEGDRDSLLSGPNGQTARLVLRAMGINPDSAYFASVLPRHTPLPDWAGLAARGLGDIVQHHIALAGARRVLALGRPIAAFLDTNAAIFCGPGLEELRRSPQRRQRFWQRWLEWNGGATG